VRFLGVFALLASGCFDAQPRPGLLCGPHDACPAGQTCDRFAPTPVCRVDGSDAGMRRPPNFGPGGPPVMIPMDADSNQMGCNGALRTCGEGEEPEHSVTLPKYELTRTEITHAQYAACLDDGACQSPASLDRSRPDYPIGGVSFQMARDYCSWAGMRLPSEAEWENAARSQRDDFEYPWGVTPNPDCARAVMMGCSGPKPVASLVAGGNLKGVMDLSGNLAEWVNDWYESPYARESDDPRGPSTGTYRVIRGGHFNSQPAELRAAARAKAAPESRQSVVGFRCAR